MTAELTAEERAAQLEHTWLGPTWRTDEDGDWILPEHTLGWQIAEWCEDHLLLPDGEVDDKGETPSWRFTDEQFRFILWWYAVDANGNFVYRTGVLQRLKGWGKDPLLAILCLVELIGPSCFTGWDEDGEPIAKPHPAAFVQIAAVNLDQTANTTDLFPRIIPQRTKDAYGIELGAENIWARHRKVRLRAVTSNPRALEGGRVTFTVLNETHHWLESNRGHKMFEVIDGNATKVRGRYLAITNAFMPGEDSVAERMRAAYERLEELGQKHRFLYDTIEADPNTPLDPDVLRLVLPIIRGDAVWLPIEEIISSIVQSAITVARSRRMWLNQIVSADDALIPVGFWKSLTADVDSELVPGDTITLGFDGGKTDDATALAALRLRDGLAVPLGAWENPHDGTEWQVDKRLVHNAVHQAFSTYKVVAFLADVAHWERDIEDWEIAYGADLKARAGQRSAIAFDMRNEKNTVMAHERFLSALENRRIQHQGRATDLSRILWRHVMNVRTKISKFGKHFDKPSRESPHKIDLYAALVLAHEARHLYATRTEKPKKQAGRVYSMANY